MKKNEFFKSHSELYKGYSRSKASLVTLYRNVKRRAAFTLAEVLIALVIIGVIAAITIPNLTRKWSDHADVQKVKTAYSILNNAYKMCISENDTPDNWNWGKTLPNWASPAPLEECIRPYLKIQKYCGTANGCAPHQHMSGLNSMYKNLYGSPSIYSEANRIGKAILSNGMSISYSNNIYINKDGSTNGGWVTPPIAIDINGLKGPNRVGYDLFYFQTTRESVIPADYNNLNAAHCDRTYDNANSGCGSSCAEWIIKHGNMDYKYRNVSAEW